MKETTPPGEELPKTGSGNGWLAALGAGLLLGGTGLVLAGRQAGRHLA
jgi:LPXTG-motif cell wall-anchored protein